MAVGRHHEAALDRVEGRQRQHRAVVTLAQEWVVEGREEQLLDQLRCGLAARAVAHVDAAVFDVERPDVVFLHRLGGGRLAGTGLVVFGSHGLTSSVVAAATMGMSRKRP
ncbi:hypothetical protein D9M68_771310 [compost metagenome]